jgi:hypothetical protein
MAIPTPARVARSTRSRAVAALVVIGLSISTWAPASMPAPAWSWCSVWGEATITPSSRSAAIIARWSP